MDEQKLPGKPDYLTSSEYNYVIQHDRRRCALNGQCPAKSGQSGQSGFCSDNLDLDHHHPRCLGGDSSFANIRLLCANENRGRLSVPTPYWNEQNYWDGNFDSARLREIQALAGWDAILDPTLDAFIAQNTNALHKIITLMIGGTGTGKGITQIGALFAVNQSVNAFGPGRPRVKHVLWLTTEQTLRDQTKRELEDEPFDLGMVQNRPVVRIAKNYADLIKGPNGASITVACPHSLWNVGEEPRRSPDEMRDALRHYDTIVFDETDFAGEQVQHIAEFATHALKFSLTASPAIMDGVDKNVREKFMKRFVLIREGAVADYQRTVMLDACLKRLSLKDDPAQITIDDLVVPCAEHDTYESLSRGARTTVNRVAEPDHVTYMAAITEAVCRADQLEQEMRKEVPDEWYSPHVMVRLNSIADIKALMKALPQRLDVLRASGHLRGEGWGATAIYQGSERDVSSADERELAGKDKHGKNRHPFMRSKDYRGQVTVDLGSKRILLMCKIGIRGINNWPILYTVDNTPTSSVQDLIQFLGRAIRWPSHLAAWHSNMLLQRFLTAKVFIPNCLMTDTKRQAWGEALKFIVNMEQEVTDAKFRVWNDLLDDVELVTNPEFDSDSPPLTRDEQLKIMHAIGGLVPVTDKWETAVATIVEQFPANKAKRVGDFTKSFKEEEGFRKTKLGIVTSLLPVDCTARLKPKDHYEPEELIRFIMNSPTFETKRATYIDAIEQSRELGTDQPALIGIVRDLIEKELNRQQTLLYREPSRTLQLIKTATDDGVLSILATELRREVTDYIDNKNLNRVYPAVYAAASIVFGIDDASNKGLMNEHPYHVAIIGRCRQQIKNVAQNLLAKQGVWQERLNCIEMN